MPSTSPKQHRFMEAISHSPSFAAKAGVSRSVGRDFAKADDKAGITKTHGGKPAGSAKSRDEHMARQANGKRHADVAQDFGVHRSTVSRGVMRNGFNRIGSAD